jgi:hypothetical protein
VSRETEADPIKNQRCLCLKGILPMNAMLDDAYRLLRESVIEFQGRPVGTVASLHPDLPAENYRECFIRDFRTDSGEAEVVPDFGDRAIGRVAPVDSMLWWVGILARYVEVTGDTDFLNQTAVQEGLRSIVDLLLRDNFEIYPTLLTPDASFMIDRRMGVYGHPLEVQALFYGALRCLQHLLPSTTENAEVLGIVREREAILRDYIRRFYWLDLERLNEIHRYRTEEFGFEIANQLNVYPESIPSWLLDWMPERGGYLAGNIGPGRIDFRFFALGNLLAIGTGLTTDEEAAAIFDLFEARWEDLIGFMPVKICYPAAAGVERQLLTGSDPKNVPWSYHNGGSWPCLLWAFVSAALRVGRPEMAQRAYETACRRVPADSWPEYYDGRRGRLIGRRASLNQVWSATSLIVADKLLSGSLKTSRIFR